MKKLIFLILLFILLVAVAMAAVGPMEISGNVHQGVPDARDIIQ